MGKAGAPQAKRDQRKAVRMNPMQASTGPSTPATNQLPASTQGRALDGQSSQGVVVPVSVVIQSRVHQIMASQLGLAMTPQQLLAHVYGMSDSEVTMLSAEQKQVLNFITHLQMVKVHSLQTQASNPPILRLNTANLSKASHAVATPLTPTNGVAAAAAASLASAPILPTSIPSPSQAANNPISLASCSASDLQQNPPILTSSANQAAAAASQRLIPVPSHAQHSADDILHLLSNDVPQSLRQFQPPHPQLQQRYSHQQTQQQIHSIPPNHSNSNLRQSMSQQSLQQQQQQQQQLHMPPQHQMDPSSYQQPSHYYDQQLQHHQQQQHQQQQAMQQQQSQSGMEYEMAQMRVQMLQMQKYISQLVQNQNQMNGQISQLFTQLMKVTTTSPLPISPPSLQTSTPVELTKSPTHDDGLAQQANMTGSLSLSAVSNLMQNSASSQQMMNDFTFDESFDQIFNNAALELQ
ncbi:hypothetical protein BJ741DRAFT_589213 [Chytriomyces cf. hyalinus JEL632]|nr:hypothetical protein BJ741DRAFT_589213 [Chytriomyces cf. hyalinus JEL632]